MSFGITNHIRTVRGTDVLAYLRKETIMTDVISALIVFVAAYAVIIVLAALEIRAYNREENR